MISISLLFLFLIQLSVALTFRISPSRIQHVPVYPFSLIGYPFSIKLTKKNVYWKEKSKRLKCSEKPNDIEQDIFDDLVEKLKGTCIFLVGMMGSGKTSVGNVLAKRLGYRFIDTDEIAEYMIEMPISEYFAQGKESNFRQLETQVLNEMSSYTRVIVSTGGGSVIKNENWGYLRHGIVIFLDTTPETIIDRMKKKSLGTSKASIVKS